MRHFKQLLFRVAARFALLLILTHGTSPEARLHDVLVDALQHQSMYTPPLSAPQCVRLAIIWLMKVNTFKRALVEAFADSKPRNSA